MRRTSVLLALVGSVAIAAPAMASDKLPMRPVRGPSPAAAPAETPDPSTQPILEMPAPPASPAPDAAPSASSPPADDPAPLAAGPGGTVLPDYPFVLFFEWDSAQLSAGAADVLDNVAERYRRGGGKVTIAGFADRSGSGDYNHDLSQRRVDVVKAYLASKDVAPDAISTQAYGEAKPVVDTADGMREPQNRRVEVTVSPAAVSAR